MQQMLFCNVEFTLNDLTYLASMFMTRKCSRLWCIEVWRQFEYSGICTFKASITHCEAIFCCFKKTMIFITLVCFYFSNLYHSFTKKVIPRCFFCLFFSVETFAVWHIAIGMMCFCLYEFKDKISYLKSSWFSYSAEMAVIMLLGYLFVRPRRIFDCLFCVIFLLYHVYLFDSKQAAKD